MFHYYKPSRALVRSAIQHCQKNSDEKYADNAVLRTLDDEGVSIDGSILLISIINKRREKLEKMGTVYDLKELVSFFCYASPFETERCRAYELIIMCFYQLMKGNVKQWKEERAQKRAGVS